MFEINKDGILTYSIEKIHLKKDDVLLFMYNGDLTSEQLKHMTFNVPEVLKNRILLITNKIKVVHIDNEISVNETDNE